VWSEAASVQAGVVIRAQALAGGLTSGAIRRRLQAGKWQRIFTGVYATFNGPLPRDALLWAVVLHAGPGAALSHETAAELSGLIDGPGELVNVTVPIARAAKCPPGVRRHVAARVVRSRHPTLMPPRTRVEETVLDLTQTARTIDQAIAWMIRACARRLTTVDRLRAALAARSKLRWRAELAVALDDVAAGCQSTLELAYLRTVERRHGLPAAARQVSRVRRGGRWYDDVQYGDYATLVELDGPAFHPADGASRDRRRDNWAVRTGWDVLRYGVEEIMGRPCEVAAEVAALLQRNGWAGRPRPCGPTCHVAP